MNLNFWRFFKLKANQNRYVICKDGVVRHASKTEVEKATDEVIKKYRYDLKELAKR